MLSLPERMVVKSKYSLSKSIKVVMFSVVVFFKAKKSCHI